MTFPHIFGLVGETPTVSGELCVYGLTEDIAAFGEPSIDIEEEYERYINFTDAAALAIGNPPKLGTEAAAFVLSLDGEWKRCTARHDGRFLYLTGPRGFIETGMSGSPILDENGAAIGLVSTGDGPSLIDCLPPWLSRRLDRAEALTVES